MGNGSHKVLVLECSAWIRWVCLPACLQCGKVWETTSSSLSNKWEQVETSFKSVDTWFTCAEASSHIPLRHFVILRPITSLTNADDAAAQGAGRGSSTSSVGLETPHLWWISSTARADAMVSGEEPWQCGSDRHRLWTLWTDGTHYRYVQTINDIKR